MATSGALINICGEVTGLGSVLVNSRYRSLRKAGMVSKGGRGPYAAQMTSRDGALTLIALMGSDREAADKTVSDFDAVVCEVTAINRLDDLIDGEDNDRRPNWDERIGRFYFDGLSLPSLQRLPERHKFEEALTALLDAAASGELSRLPDNPHFHVAITVFGPVPRATIEIDYWWFSGRRHTEEITYILSDILNQTPENYREVDAKLADRFQERDLEIRRKITHKTIFAVAAALSSGGADEQ
ncbi:hypothetical protein [Rhizobium sp.]